MANASRHALCPPPVARALERAVELGEIGIQVAAYQGEELIVDAWIGDADPASGRPVDRDTLFPIFSTTKAFTVAAVHLQAERGLLDLNAPVAEYWPAYGSHGKGDIRISDLLQHRSGVPHLPAGADAEQMADWERMTSGLAALRPQYPPGVKSTYQARSMGWILGEVVRRTDGLRRDFGRFVADELFGPVGAGSTWLGLPQSEEPRLAALIGEYDGPTSGAAAPARASAYGTLTAPDLYSRRALRAACLPASGAITTAGSAARFWAMLANGGELSGLRVLSRRRLWECTARRANPFEFDEVLGMSPLIGIGGFWLGGPYPNAEAAPGDRPRVLCQPGAGGSIGWADLDTKLSVMICHNRLFANYPPRPIDEHPHTAIGNAIRAVAA